MTARPSLTTIAIITADRPTALRRSIDSLVQQCETYQHRSRLIVVDGSQHPEHQGATRAAVTAVATTGVLEAEYVGASEASRFRERLIEHTGHAPDLPIGPIGANRNLALLLTAGELTLSVDDDVVCTTWKSPNSHAGLAITANHLDCRETAFFSSRDEALQAATLAPVDLLGAHANLLDQPVSSLVAQSEPPADLTRACPHVLAGLQEGPSHVVKATFAGLVGDDGGYCPHRRLFASRSVRDRLWASPEVLRTSMTSRETLKVVTTTVVTHDANFQAFCMGLSNRSITPPFMPAGRNEDGVFGATLIACDRSAVFGHLPVGVIHDSDRPSTRSEARMHSARESRVAELVIALLRQHASSVGATTAAARLRALGDMLLETGGLHPGHLADLATIVTLETRSREFERAEEVASNAACPDYWRAELDEYRSTFLESATHPGFFLPIEFHGRGSIDDGYAALGSFLRDFGHLMVAWPELWEAARDLNLELRT